MVFLLFVKLTTPLQLHFASKDKIVGFSDPPSQELLKQRLVANNVTNHFFVYDTGHGFANNPDFFDVDNAKLARERTFAFFENLLKLN